MFDPAHDFEARSSTTAAPANEAVKPRRDTSPILDFILKTLGEIYEEDKKTREE